MKHYQEIDKVINYQQINTFTKPDSQMVALIVVANYTLYCAISY